MQPQLILASTSPYRRQLLERLGVSFDTMAPDCDERAVAPDSLPADQAAVRLATAKAQSVFDQHPNAIVIGSDQIAADEHGQLHKPGSHDKALAQIQRLRGSTHYLYTAMTVMGPDGFITEHLDITSLSMEQVTDEEIEAVLQIDQPYDCAGAYKIEGASIRLFDAIISKDHTAITGLPLLALMPILRKFGL